VIALARSRADLAGVLDALPGPVGLVPTMGALHDGHAALIDAAREICVSVLVSIFVNPTQFAPGEDLAVYPRTLQDDLRLCEAHGADAVWAPGVADVYPGGDPVVRVEPGPLGAQLEGSVRPTHFAGVLTVVAKYFALIRPALGFFGEKDYQQLTLIRRMAADLDLGVAVVGVPTVREPDGLALSSRNAFLGPAERQQAVTLSRALFAGRDAAAGGGAGVLAAARRVLEAAHGVDVDYLELRGEDLGEVPAAGRARLLVAARVGATRLIDNVAVELPDGTD
jgi:pantoate--beta-alanine ligase